MLSGSRYVPVVIPIRLPKIAFRRPLPVDLGREQFVRIDPH